MEISNCIDLKKSDLSLTGMCPFSDKDLIEIERLEVDSVSTDKKKN